MGTNAGLEPSVARGADAALRGREGVGRGGLARFVRASVLLFFFPSLIEIAGMDSVPRPSELGGTAYICPRLN